MKFKFIFRFTVAILLSQALLLSACQSTQSNENSSDGAPLVSVSILPQAYFVERIAGENVRINVLVGPGDEPHTYEPTPEQMRLLNDSQVFFSIGVEYEQNWVPRFQDINPDLKIIDSANGIDRIAMGEHHHHEHEVEGEHHHDEEAEGEDHHEGEGGNNLDPHVWLSPENGKIIAANILESLITLAPEKESVFQDNYTRLIDDIEALETSIETALSGLTQRTFMVFHPAWGYFAHQYDLEQIAVQVGGQDPSPSELAQLIDKAREENIRVIFIQPSFDSASVEALSEEINAEIVMVDPLARDWLANLDAVANAFAAALSE